MSQFFEDNKMGETTAASNPSLQVSVSFGRFGSDSLSWEKWSAFSPNKYLEEVEKCATPGSVAQKKAYFEAHYKKIAARKAELLAQEKQTEKDRLRSEDQNCEDPRGNLREIDSEFDVSNSQSSIEGVLHPEAISLAEMGGAPVGNLEEDFAVSAECQNLSLEAEERELEIRSDISQSDKPEEVVCFKEEESTVIKAEDAKEVQQHVENEIGKASEVGVKEVKLDHPKESKKVTSLNRESNAAKTKKKPVLPTSRASPISTPRSSRPASTPTKTLASASSMKKGSSPSLSTRKSTLTAESKTVAANTSLHMSLRLGPSDPDPAPTTTLRKSFIMEKMGDKDIVKRAFKTFQNNFNQPTTSDEDRRTSAKKQVPSRGTQPRIPTSIALCKENGRPTKVDNIKMDKRNGNAVRAGIGAERTKGFSKSSGEKSNARESQRTHLQPKSKEEKEAENKKTKPNFKATPLPAFYRGQKVSKSHAEKADVKTENPR